METNLTLNQKLGLAFKKTWTTRYKNLTIEICHWGFERERPDWEPINNGKGVWSYYIYIPERLVETEELFNSIWIEDKLYQITPTSPERVLHNYYDTPLVQIDWHGGITYYHKSGYSKAHRVVQAGCDYNHLYDQERGYDYDLEEVLQDAKNTVDELVELLKIKQTE